MKGKINTNDSIRKKKLPAGLQPLALLPEIMICIEKNKARTAKTTRYKYFLYVQINS